MSIPLNCDESFRDMYLNTLVFDINRPILTAYLIEAKQDQGLFCMKKISRSLFCQGNCGQEFHETIRTGLDSVLKEFKDDTSIAMDRIGVLICLVEYVEEETIQEDTEKIHPRQYALAIEDYFQRQYTSKTYTSSFTLSIEQEFHKMLHTIQNHQDKSTSMLHKVSEKMVEMFGFSKECLILQSIPAKIASFISCMHNPGDVGLEMGETSDYFFIPSNDDIPNGSNLDGSGNGQTKYFPNPFFYLDAEGNLPSVKMVKCEGAGRARKIIRDEYTKTWKAFKHLVQVISPGGCPGLDDKLFLFFFSQAGIGSTVRKYEHGTCVTEFNDLRANPRCTLEGQALFLRRMLSQSNISANDDQQKGMDGKYWGAAHCLPFKPFDRNNCPRSCWIWSSTATSNQQLTCSTELECSAEVISQVTGAPCFIQSIRIDDEEAQKSEKMNSNSVVGAVYLSLSVQHRLRHESRATLGDIIQSYQSKRQFGSQQDSPILQTSELTWTVPILEENDQQYTPRLNMRQSWPLNAVSEMNENNHDLDCTPTLQNRSVRAVSSAAELMMRERRYGKEASGFKQNSDAIDQASSSRNRSLSLSVSTLTNFVDGSDDNQNASSSSPTITSQDQVPQLSSPPTSSYSSTEMGHSRTRENTGNIVQQPIKVEYERIDNADDDLWLFYGAMLEEYIRLFDSLQQRF